MRTIVNVIIAAVFRCVSPYDGAKFPALRNEFPAVTRKFPASRRKIPCFGAGISGGRHAKSMICADFGGRGGENFPCPQGKQKKGRSLPERPKPPPRPSPACGGGGWRW